MAVSLILLRIVPLWSLIFGVTFGMLLRGMPCRLRFVVKTCYMVFLTSRKKLGVCLLELTFSNELLVWGALLAQTLGLVQSFVGCLSACLTCLLWVEAGAAPCQFTESRMVILPKPKNISDLNVVDLRPITVLSCWWRLWVGSLLRTSDVARWISLNVPDEFAVGNCVSTEQCVVELLEKFCRQKYMLSLDFSKAFDRLYPEITRRLLLKLGWPRGIVGTFSFVWSRQQRWVSWSNHVHHQKLPSPALPQRDPCGPLIMTLWVIQGLAHVERVAGGSAFTRIYVDDIGTLLPMSLWCLVWLVWQRWHGWKHS